LNVATEAILFMNAASVTVHVRLVTTTNLEVYSRWSESLVLWLYRRGSLDSYQKHDKEEVTKWRWI